MNNHTVKSPRSIQPGDRVLRVAEVLEMTGYGRTTLYSRMKNHQFPLNFSLGGQTVGWLESEVLDWLEEQRRESRAMIAKPIHLKVQQPYQENQSP